MATWQESRYQVGREALGRSAGRQNNYLSHRAIVCGERQSFLHHELKQSWGFSSYPAPFQWYINLQHTHSSIFHHCTSSCSSSLSHFSTIHYHLSITCPARKAYTRNTQTTTGKKVWWKNSEIGHGKAKLTLQASRVMWNMCFSHLWYVAVLIIYRTD